MNCAFYDTSRNFGNNLEHALRKILELKGYLTFISQSHSHFTKWPLLVVILTVALVLDLEIITVSLMKVFMKLHLNN